MNENVIRVTAFPESKKEKIIQLENGSLEIYVKEPAQRNLANTRVRECVAAHVGVPVARIAIQSGHRARKKALIILPERT